MKRILSVLLASMLMAICCVPVFAAAEQATNQNNGKITIENAVAGETYSAYQMAVLESFSNKNYSYKVLDTWKAFFSTEAAKKYFILSENGYISTTSEIMQNSDKETMAKDALAYIKANNITPTTTAVAQDQVVFDNLSLGYYIVDTSLGTLCSIDTTDTEAVITDKNSGPSVIKTVQEDSSGTYGEKNDADLYQDILFRIVIDCKKGAYNYVLHDTMQNMTLKADSIKVYMGAPLADDTNLIPAKITTETPEVVNYEVTVGEYTEPAGDITYGTTTFTISFKQVLLDTVDDTNDLYVYYTASLTDDAFTGNDAQNGGNDNETYITYGNAQESIHDTTTTYVYEFDIVKTDDSNHYLSGATFSLWDAAEGGNQIKLTKIDDNSYRVLGENEIVAGVVELLTGKAVTIIGLDGKTDYYLKEEAAPQGYNQLDGRKKITLSDANNSYTGNDSDVFETNKGGIQVINKTGSLLPSTGGVGTTMFILVGAILVLGAGVLLIAKTRMAKMAG